MATAGPKSVRHQTKVMNKRSSDQTVDATCRCRASKKTLCQFCKKSPKKFKIVKGKTSADLTDIPEVAIVSSIAVTEECGSRFASRYCDLNFSEYFSKNFKKVLEIKPGDACVTINFLKDKIWAPTGNSVQVYNTTGTNVKRIDINSPWSVEKAINGDIFIACYSNSGLYVMDDDEAPRHICKGSFSDVYAHRDKVYALEYEKKQIIEFCCSPDVDDVKQRWSSEKEWRVDEASIWDRLIVTGDEDLQMYVSQHNIHKVSLYNTQGKCIKQFGSSKETGDGNLKHPRLCGVDRQSHLLVADWQNNVYKVLDPGTGQWRSTRLSGEKWVYDAALDDEGNLWLSQYGKVFIITKHEPQ